MLLVAKANSTYEEETLEGWKSARKEDEEDGLFLVVKTDFEADESFKRVARGRLGLHVRRKVFRGKLRPPRDEVIEETPVDLGGVDFCGRRLAVVVVVDPVVRRMRLSGVAWHFDLLTLVLFVKHTHGCVQPGPNKTEKL